MKGLRKFDFVKFHTPTSEQEANEVYIVVDELADDEDVKSILVMEIHQTLTIPGINTFQKADFVLDYRPTEAQVEAIMSGKKLEEII